jgi:hypothetical protein
MISKVFSVRPSMASRRRLATRRVERKVSAFVL